MQGPFGTRARTRKPSINITSLIDVMFLLLIFFMVSSTFRTQSGIDVSLPESQTAASLERSEHEIVVGRDGTLHFGTEAVSPQELREQIRALFAEDPEAVLVLTADKGADFQAFIDALDIARDEGGTRVVMPTEAREAAGP
ncbi:MAG: biopolymer transporter ExbD [Candidatus Hydrogenedentes bacterium]|nr:biopolymer transporter ExbD [Candidatus Hydrogenedentota bacterium]